MPDGSAPTTNVSEIPEIAASVRRAFDAGRTRPLEWRSRQLDGIVRFLESRQAQILEALHQDVGKPELEGFTTEVAYTLGEAKLARNKLGAWTKPERVWTSLLAQPGKSRIHREPLGTVLIIGPWNYPFQLVMAPLIGAVAAGNAVVIKPSEVAPATSSLLAKLLPEYVDSDCIRIVEGGVPETTALLAQRWDHIFYTGNGAVGRIVMEAAAKHLTPVTLELGGKSPCIVDRSADLQVAARRIAWGKFSNSGQTCVAPDYVLAHEAIEDDFCRILKDTLHKFYGDDPQKSGDYGRVVNERHHQRLMKLIPGSGEVFVGGKADESDRYIAPTVLRDVKPDAPVMADEIFGPLLPVLKVRDIDDAIRFVNARPKPLALYVFANDEEVQRSVIERTTSGGATVNHAWMHLAVHGLPFGGVGPSGMGAYHGKASFETFSHRKSVLVKPAAIDPDLLYPPYDDTKKKWIKRLM